MYILISGAYVYAWAQILIWRRIHELKKQVKSFQLIMVKTDSFFFVVDAHEADKISLPISTAWGDFKMQIKDAKKIVSFTSVGTHVI